MQRYLTGKSIAQSRLSLLFNAVAKIPMQFFILFIGAMVFVFFLFVQPPLTVSSGRLTRKCSPRRNTLTMQAPVQPGMAGSAATPQRRVIATRSGAEDGAAKREFIVRAQKKFDAVRTEARSSSPSAAARRSFNDTNYIFLSFVTKYLPIGVVGLVIGVIFSAAMSASSGEINSLATVSVIDMYRRHMGGRRATTITCGRRGPRPRSGAFMLSIFASIGGSGFGALIEAVNMVGSLFYGGCWACFVLAFFFPRVGARRSVLGVLVGEAAILLAWKFTPVAFSGTT